MTRDDIIRMAREASGGTVWWSINSDALERFAALFVAAERDLVVEEARHIIKRAEALATAADVRARREK